nr:coagulation factor XII-like [Paramormyrops kingsleyae]
MRVLRQDASMLKVAVILLILAALSASFTVPPQDEPLDEAWQAPVASCVFPFLYQGKLYDYCIRTWEVGPPWCSSTGNYDQDHQWQYCYKEGYGYLGRFD